ncbi:AraC family transcriptional regulator [Gorillibacterium sp. sgz5001074]|uniref:AraC family transcriptional regulator n=1 Tax=Gorillibacterium sp. sgz5001074 TaxID=3446695 RepID=UPI003F66E608
MDLNYTVAINPHPARGGELGILFSGYSQTSHDHRVGPLVHDHYLLHFVLSGRGTYYCAGNSYPVGKGGAFMIFPGELVRYDADPAEPWEYRWIGMRGRQADELLGRLGITPHRPVMDVPYSNRTAGLFKRIEQVLRKGGPACDLEAGGWTRLALAELVQGRAGDLKRGLEPTSEIKRQVEQAVRWLTLQYAQPISIEHMAQNLGYHRTHLSKMFKRETGMSPMEFLLQIRMERAKLLLAEPLTVEQVAASVGYTDPLYFSKQFKRSCGQSPTEYRRSLAAGPAVPEGTE